jgi:hypothetical protein
MLPRLPLARLAFTECGLYPQLNFLTTKETNLLVSAMITWNYERTDVAA